MPYARFVQALRVASDSETSAQRDRMVQAAFIGWQVRSATAKTPRFKVYLKRMGLGDTAERLTPEQRAAEVAHAREISTRARRAFSVSRLKKVS